ncbi:hypothetical protein KI387_009408, partial [Taxus chinensis]
SSQVKIHLVCFLGEVMGFDNESIINIQSLPGEYFCPVGRQRVYPNEAVQTQYSKAVQEANPVLADAIGRVTVHCLHHKSGCTWQGPLSESIAH